MSEVESVPEITWPAPAPSRRREWIGLAALMLCTMLVLLDNGIIFLALPRVTADLGASSSQTLWIADIYAFFAVAFMITMGRLGDQIGHRKLLLMGAGAFCVLSIIAAFSVNATMLIVVRALLGVAAATMGPCLLVLVKEMYPDPRKMASAFSMMAMSAMLGVSLGPVVGGLLLNSFWWGSVFLIAAPVTALVVVLGPFVLPESQNHFTRRLDLVSVVLSLAAILPVIYGLTELANSGWRISSLAAIVLGLVFGIVFVRRQRRIPEPVLDLQLFGIRAIGITVVLYLLTGVVQGGNSLILIQHLQLVEGFSPLAASLWMAVPIGVAIIGVHVATFLAKRLRPSTVLIGGLLTAAAGELVLRQTETGSLATLIVGLCIVMLGTSPVGALSEQLIINAAPAGKAGSAGALGSTGGDFGSALGVAAFGSLVTMFYIGHVRIPKGISPAETAAANTNIIRAGAVARQLPANTGDQIIAAARDAFNAATNHIATIATSLFVLLLIMVAATLRHIRPIGSED